MQDERYRSSHRLDPRGFAMALAVVRGSVWWAPGVVAIPLQRKNERSGEVVLVSAEDADQSRFYWSHSRWGYPRRRDKTGRSVFIHREIMGLKHGDKMVVDHINRDRFDCRRENMRVVTHAQNCQNQGARRNSTSPHRGVSLTAVGRWAVNHKIGDQQFYAGTYDTEEEAAAVARAWRHEHLPFAID